MNSQGFKRSVQNSLVVAALSGTIARRDFEETLSLKDGQGRWLAWATLLLAVGFSGLLSMISLATVGDTEIPARVQEAVAHSSAASFMLLAMLSSLAIHVLYPNNQSLRTLLEILPQSRLCGETGLILPVMQLSGGIGLLFSIPTLALQFTTREITASRALLIAVGVVLCVAVSNLSVYCGLNLAIRGVRRIFGGHELVSRSISGYVVMFSVLGIFAPSVLSDGLTASTRQPLFTGRPDRLLANIFIADTSGKGLIELLGLLGWLALLCALYIAISRANSYGGERKLKQFSPGRSLARVPKPRTLGIVVVQAMIAIRSPLGRLTVLYSPVLAIVAIVFKTHGIDSISSHALYTVAMNTGFLVSAQTAGRTLPFRWLDRHLTGSGAFWNLHTIISSLFVHILFATGTTVMLFLALGSPLENFMTLLVISVISWACALLIGTLIPFDEDRPANFGPVLLIGGGLFFGASFIFGRVFEIDPLLGYLIAALEVVILNVGFWWAARRSESRSPTHAY